MFKIKYNKLSIFTHMIIIIKYYWYTKKVINRYNLLNYNCKYNNSYNWLFILYDKLTNIYIPYMYKTFKILYYYTF